MKDRITEFLVKEIISPAEFADKIGVQRSSVSHVLNGRNYPGASFIQKMLSTYRNLNPRWLLLGEGPMLESNTTAREPSLFSFPQAPEIPVKRIAITEPGFEQNVKKEMRPDSAPLQKETENNLSKVDHELMSNLLELKDVERIVLFFRDKTFSVYSPSK